MKKLFYLAMSILLCLTMCKKDDENPSSSGGNECPSGYEGNNCDIEIRTKFFGTYVGVLTYEGTTSDDVSLELSKFVGDVEKIYWDQTFYLVVSGSTTFNIPEQEEDIGGDLVKISGNGSLNGNILTILFTFSMSGTSVDFEFKGTKQKSTPAIEDSSLWLNMRDLLLKEK